MKKNSTLFLMFFSCCILAQPCPQYNLPVPPGNTCATAAPFCATYLNGYCSDNGGFSADTPGNLAAAFGCSIENNQWMSFVACEDSVAFTVNVGNCGANEGMEFAVFSTPDCLNFTAMAGCLTVLPDSIGLLVVPNLIPGDTYFFMIDGVNGDACNWQIVGLYGVSGGTVLQEDITPGQIDGPTVICLDSPTGSSPPTPYTAIGPDCKFVPADPNNNTCDPGTEFCPSAPQKFREPFMDTAIIAIAWDTVWQILPPTAGYFVNNINIGTTVEVVWDSVGSFKLDADIVAVAWDTIVFLNDGINGCATICPDNDICDIPPLDVEVGAPDNIFEFYQICPGDCVFAHSQVFCAPGQFVIQVVDATGCVDTITISITESPGITVNIFGQMPICFGEPVTLLATATAGSAFFQWLGGTSGPNFTATSPGIYTVTATNAFGCTAIASYQVAWPPPIPTLNLPPLSLCQAELPYSFFGTNVTASGNYSATFISWQGCDSTVVQSITVFPAVAVGISSSAGTMLPIGGTTVLDAGSGFSSYLWQDGSSGQTFDTDMPGTYSVTVTAATGCTATASITLMQMTLLCQNFNLPAPPGDSCQSAPLFCGENINGYCSNNGGYAAGTSLDGTFGCPLDNTQWLRFTPCEPVVELTFTLSNCAQGEGLELGVFSSDDCENFTPVLTCTALLPNSSNSVTIQGLNPGGIYYLVLDGNNGDACDYRIELVSGISPEPPVYVTVSDGYIEGPDEICPGDVATYTLVPPVCELVSGTAGCPVPPEACPSADSVAIIWHIPTVAHFIGDSVNVLSVNVVWDSLPYPGNDSIWVEFLYFTDSTAVDPLVYCECQGTCGGNIEGMTVTGLFMVVELTAHLTCPDPSIVFCGEIITAEGVYTCPVSCGQEVLTVTVDLTGDFFDLGTMVLCAGECFDLQGLLFCDGGTYTEVLPDPVTGCLDTYTFTIIVINPPPLQVGPVTELCDATGQFYTVGFSIFGGAPPYHVNGVPVSGNFYQSSPIPSGQFYGFQVGSQDNCNSPVLVQGIWDCPCLNSPGTVALTPIYHCEGDLATVQLVTPPQTGPGDLLLFVLHEGNGPALVNPLLTNATGIFGFDPGTMQLGQTYYISPVTGPDDGSGMIDFSALCTQVAPGQQVVFYETPVAALSPPDTLTCLLTELPLQGAVQGGSGQYSYAWAGPDGFVSDAANPVVGNSGSYFLTVTDDLTGCTATTSALVPEDAEYPDLAAPAGGELTCAEPTALLAASSSTPGVALAWTLPDGQVVVGENITAALPGAYAVVATAPNGCTAMALVPVEEDMEQPGLAAPAGGELTCAEPTALLAASSSTAGVTFAWTLPDGQVVVGESITAAVPGAYTVVATAPNGCTAMALVPVEEDMEQPGLAAPAGGELTCAEPTALLAASSSTAGVALAWTLPDGQVVVGESITAAVPGGYTVVATAPNGCTAMALVPVEEDMEQPGLAAPAGGELTCAEPTALLAASSATAGVTFAWTLPDGQVVVGESITAAVPGVYAVVATAPNGCTAEGLAQVTGSTTADLLAEVETVPPTCHGDRDGFIEILGVSGGAGPYLLTIGDAPFPTGGLRDLPAGNYLITLEDANGCTADTVVALPEPAAVWVTLGDDQSIRLGETVTLDVQSNIVPSDILWSGPDGQTWQGLPSLVLQPVESGTYNIVISDITACTASDQVNIVVEQGQQVFVPSAFSPNGDGINDVLTVFSGPGVRQVRSFLVFDRWGAKVYEYQNFSPNDPAIGWDGNRKGKPMSPAVFVYWAEVEFINGEMKVVTGDVTLVR